MDRETECDRPAEVHWGAPSSDTALPSGYVHIWRAESDECQMSLARHGRLLSRDELERAERYHFDRDRHRFISRRGILRKILGIYTGTPPARLTFDKSSRGKPELAGSQGAGKIRFSLSFSEGLALFAFTRGHDVGIDIERVRLMPETEEIASRFFSPTENSALMALPETARNEAFFSLWTCKEAFIKATGDGMSLPPSEFCVSLGPGSAPKLSSVEGDSKGSSHWSLFAFTPDIGYTAALAVRGRPSQVRHWKWDEALLDPEENSNG